jgi:hypothetical protein
LHRFSVKNRLRIVKWGYSAVFVVNV